MCSELCPYVKAISADANGEKQCLCELDDRIRGKGDAVKNTMTGDLWWCIKLQAIKHGKGTHLCLQRSADFWLLDKYEARRDELAPLLVVPEKQQKYIDLLLRLSGLEFSGLG